MGEIVGHARDTAKLAGEEHLSGGVTAPVTSEPAAVKAKAETVKAEPTKGEKDKSATPAQAKPAEAHEADESDDHPVPRKALIEERRKRQDYERKLAQLEGQLHVYQQQAQPRGELPKARDPSSEFYSDPVKFVSQEVGQAVTQTRIELSEHFMRSQHQDYDETVNAFVEVAKATPHLLQQFHASPFPAQFAYEAGKAIKAGRGAKNYDEWESNIRKDEREKALEEYRKQQALDQASNATTSSATARGNGATSAPKWAGPTPLGQILRRA